MNIKSFFAETLGQALELGIGTPDDVLKHVTPELLARHLPRPLWARLFTACLGAPRVDARLVVDTIGVPNLCEHIPAPVIWQVIAEIGVRALGHAYVAPSPPIVTPSVEKRSSVLAPPPDTIDTLAPGSAAAVSQPLADLITELEADDRPVTPTRGRTPTSQRFRQSSTGIGRLSASSSASSAAQRRPQAAAPLPPAAPPKSVRRPTESEDFETDASGTQVAREIAVDDSQLVDWQSTETTQASEGEDFSDIGRKR